MRRPLIDKAGLVVNVIDIEDGAKWLAPDGLTLGDASDTVSPGDQWDGKQFVPAEPQPPAKSEIEQLKDRLAAMEATLSTSVLKV